MKSKYIVIAPVLGTTIQAKCETLKAGVATQLKENGVVFSKWNYAPNPWNSTKKEHCTLAPPFLASFEAASALNLGISMFELKHQEEDSPLLDCVIEVGRVSWFRNEQEDVLKLEVRSTFLEKAAVRLRGIIAQDPDMEFCFPLPEGVNLHITLCSGKGLYEKVNNWVEQQNGKRSKIHHVRVPCMLLLAKYQTGWHTLTKNPPAA